MPLEKISFIEEVICLIVSQLWREITNLSSKGQIRRNPSLFLLAELEKVLE